MEGKWKMVQLSEKSKASLMESKALKQFRADLLAYRKKPDSGEIDDMSLPRKKFFNQKLN